MFKRVLVAGTFEIIHPGHIYLFQKAKELGKVIVVVARDKNVERFKGRRPIIPESQRLEVVKNLKPVDEAVLGYEGPDILKIVEDLKPDIILLGPDQSFSERKIRNELKSRGLNINVIRLSDKRKCPLCSTSAIIEKIVKVYRELSSD